MEGVLVLCDKVLPINFGSYKFEAQKFILNARTHRSDTKPSLCSL